MELTNEVLDKVFYNDGSLRDIYVFNVNLTDWQKFLDWILTSTWDIVFYNDGYVTDYNEKDVVQFFQEKENHRIIMAIKTKNVIINCHFFSEDEIEVDIDPKEVKSKTEAYTVFEFMKDLSRLLNKQSILSRENSPDYPLVRVNPDGTLIISTF